MLHYFPICLLASAGNSNSSGVSTAQQRQRRGKGGGVGHDKHFSRHHRLLASGLFYYQLARRARGALWDTQKTLGRPIFFFTERPTPTGGGEKLTQLPPSNRGMLCCEPTFPSNRTRSPTGLKSSLSPPTPSNERAHTRARAHTMFLLGDDESVARMLAAGERDRGLYGGRLGLSSYQPRIWAAAAMGLYTTWSGRSSLLAADISFLA